MPRALRPLATFEARDHFGDPDATLRANVDAYLAEHGIDLHGGRVLMLANPRSFGYVFNPLTIYWCYDEVGRRRVCVIAEVHNTYGGRHCYLLAPDAGGHADVAKEFFVSPFFAVDGRYEMRFSEPGDDLEVSIVLRRGESMEPVFRAKLAGHRTVARVRSVSRAAARHACGSWKVIALIRWQGIRLWLRRVPLVPRPQPAHAHRGDDHERHRRAVRRSPACRTARGGSSPRRGTSRCTPRSPSGCSTVRSARVPLRVELPDGSIVGAAAGPPTRR